MPVYETPGVHYERVDAAGPAISPIRTDVAGFVGIAARGPLDTPVPVQSWRQFEAHFGGFTGSGFLAYAVRAFFENGGRRCWVVRVASQEPTGGARAADAVLRDASGQPAWRIAASSPGAWGNQLTVQLRETHRAQTLTDPHRSSPAAAAVASTSGFSRGTLVRLSQDPLPPVWKVVSDVDPVERRLYWVHPDASARLPYDRPLHGLDPDRPFLIESVEYTLLAREGRVPVLLQEGLSVVPEHPTYAPLRLGALRRSPAPATGGGEQDALVPTPRPVVIEELRALPAGEIRPLALPPDGLLLDGGADGLALLTTCDFTGEPYSPLDSDEVRRARRRGLRALDEVDEVAVVAIPDVHVQPLAVPATAPPPVCIPDPCLPPPPPFPAPARPPSPPELPPVFGEDEVYRVQAALVQHCEERADRIALLDPPFATAGDAELGIGAVRAWRARFESRCAALYYPWLRVPDPLRGPGQLTRMVPPSGHVAGLYARTDFETGVHKAPANEALAWVQGVTVPIDDAVQAVLNPAGVNAIRALPGRGIRVFGARTVCSDPDWRYVNVWRLILMIRKAVDLSTQWAVFEPNDETTRAKVRLALGSFLIALWQRGALAGETTREAFFVRCDAENNPASERGNGRLLAEVGIAPSKPFEFVVLRVGRTDNAFEVTEAGAMARVGGR